jgi:hypothetical protein
MADEIVSLNHNKENIFEFDLSVEGVNESEVTAKFIIESTEMNLAFKCSKDSNGKWSVKLPPLPMLEKTAYPFHFAIDAEGYHFEPLKGVVNVVGSNEVYVTTPKTKLASPTAVKVVKEETKPIEIPKVVATRSREKSVQQIAEELMKKESDAKKPADEPKKEPKAQVKIEPKEEVKEAILPKIEVTPPSVKKKGDKDDVVRKVLEQAGMKSKAKQTRRFSVLKDE